MVGREVEEIEKELEEKYKYPLTWTEYFEALDGGTLLGLRCGKCDSVTCPPMSVCQECGSKNLEKIELSGEGELKTMTSTFTTPEGFGEPYVFCYVELEEGPWVPGRLDYDPKEATEDDQEIIGSEVRLKEGLTLPGDKHTGGDREIPLFEIKK